MLLNVKRVREIMEEQIDMKTMYFVVRGYGETVMLLAEPETSVVKFFSNGLIVKAVTVL